MAGSSEQSIGRLGKVQSRPQSVDDPCTEGRHSATNGIPATPSGILLCFQASGESEIESTASCPTIETVTNLLVKVWGG